MKLTKCEQCGGPTAEGLPLCPDCMRATGAAADQIAAAEELRDIARVLSITANTDANIREAIVGILNIAEGWKEGNKMELLQFVFSSFWVWLGCVVLIVAAGEAVATAAAGFRQKRKVSVYHVGDVTRVEVENAGRADIPAAVKALNEQTAEVDE